MTCSVPSLIIATCSLFLPVITPMTASGQTVSGSATASAQAERIAASATEPADLEAPRPQYARLDSVVRYSAAGVPTRITAADSGEPGINALAPLYGRIPSDTVAKLKGAYAHFIRSSDAAHRFRNTLQVLDALEAPTKEEYHRRIKALPVRVEAVPTVGADGRMGTRKDYFLEGRLTLSTFESPIDLKAEPASIEDQRSGPSAATLDGDLGAHDDCTYVDVNGTLHSGPCATAQEIEDALTEFIVVEADGDASHDDYEYARSIYCFYYPGDLDLCLAESPSPDAEMAGLLPSSGTETYRGPFVGIVWDDANTRPCLMEGIQGGIAAVAWVGSKVAAWHLFTLPATATPPTGAVSLVVFGAVTSGFALAGSAASFLQCLGYD